jgi:hypothetical protein
MVKEVRPTDGRVFLSLAAIPLAFTLCVTSARGADDRGNDAACAMITAYSQMGADHARLVPFAPHCQDSYECASTRQAMITAGRTDVEMLNCDHAPAPDPQKIAAKQASLSCFSLAGNAELLAGLLEPSPVPVTGIDDTRHEIARLVPLCNTSPYPSDPCEALAAFNRRKLPNPGLVCTITNYGNR